MPTSSGFKRLAVVGVCAIAGAAGFYLTRSGTESRAADAPSASAAANAAVAVDVAAVAQRTVPLQLQAIGNVEPYSTVALKARVDGEIVEVDFTDGQEVRQGATLFKVDPRPYQTALAQAEASAARDAAARDQARAQERRYQELLDKNFISKDAYSQYRTNAETAEAVAKASAAAVETARLNLSYTVIRSPIDGYPGKTMIQRGNLVKANDTNALVVLNQVHPIYVNFAVPEQQLAAIRTYMKDGPIEVVARAPAPALTSANAAPGGDAGGESAAAPAAAGTQAGPAPAAAGTQAGPAPNTPLAKGRLVFVDNAVDPATGTIKLRAQFENHDNMLWPGQFINITLTLKEDKDLLLVPTQSIQTGPSGNFVYVVKPDMTAELRSVVVDRAVGGDSVIARGLAKDEKVVTAGQLRLAPGSKVSLHS